MTSIEPRTLKGFRDFLPEKQIARQKFIDTIKKTYELFGFDPIETPALEYADILTGKYGDEGDKLMYRFKDNGDRDVALRYDLTIPLARLIAQNGEIKEPFKRYQVSPVWRAENTQRGRYREFYQCDADIIGSNSPLADAEILALGANALRSLGLSSEDFVFRINHREVLKAFYDSLNLSPEVQSAVLREVDKLEKIGKEEVLKNLQKLDIEESDAEKILKFAETKISTLEEIDALSKAEPELADALTKIREIVSAALSFDASLPWTLDFSIARGLDYYTGMIFETTLTKLSDIGSVFSGGRYDNLIGMFGNKQISAVGASIGLDRFYAALEELSLIKEEKTVTKVLVANFEESLQADYLKIVSDLRSAGINTSIYFETTDLKKQLAYASDKNIRYVIIYGTNEAKEGKVLIKDMEKGEQREVSITEIKDFQF